jgi:hypothetical protein
MVCRLSAEELFSPKHTKKETMHQKIIYKNIFNKIKFYVFRYVVQ